MLTGRCSISCWSLLYDSQLNASQAPPVILGDVGRRGRHLLPCDRPHPSLAVCVTHVTMNEPQNNTKAASVPIKAPTLPPRPPPARLAPPSMTATSGYRARALAKVSKAVQSTSEYVSPRLDTAKQSAVARLSELRERHDSWEADRSAQSSPSRSFSSSSRQSTVSREYLDPVAAARRSSSTSTSSSDQPSRWGGWGNYFSSNYRKDRDPSTYGSEMIVSFPGVRSSLSGMSVRSTSDNPDPFFIHSGRLCDRLLLQQLSPLSSLTSSPTAMRTGFVR